MKRTAILCVMAAGLLLGCNKGTPKYSEPAKHYPILYTYAADLGLVWDATLKSLEEQHFQVTTADKAAGRIETAWSDTGWAPARRCKYGFVTYWENPVRKEKLTIEVKTAPLSAPAPVYPPQQPAYPGYPQQAPGYPPPAQPGYPGFPGGGGDVLAQAGGFPPPMGGAPVMGGAPAGQQMGTMVLVKSRGQSILDEACGGEPKEMEITSDTSTEYKLLYTIGAKLGQRMEQPQ